MCGECNYIGSIAFSILVGIIIGAIFFLGLIPGITTVIAIVLGLAVLNFILFFINFVFGENNEKCRCRFGNSIVVGIIGTIALSIIALGITLTTGSVLVAILIGVLAFFVTFMLINILLYLLCVTNRECNCR